MTEFIIIAAVAENRVIGRKGEIPWHIPEDFRRFRQLTLNHPVIMGQTTYESILRRLHRPLPERTSIVLSDKAEFQDSGIVIARSIDEAKKKAASLDQIAFVAGGQSVYEQMLPFSSSMYLTEVKQFFPDGDAFFPEFSKAEWQETERENHDGCSFVRYERNYWRA